MKIKRKKPKCRVLQADALHLPFKDQSVDLIFGSLPYCDCRSYDDGTLPDGHVVLRDATTWVAWAVSVTEEALRVSKGAVVWVLAGPTRKRSYWPAVEGLMWEWFKQGGSMYRPAYWKRSGIPGSGGDQWLRADVEYVCCFKRPGKLPWTDNTAMGHPPKYKTGGALSYRTEEGCRINEIKHNIGSSARKKEYRTAPKIANPGNFITTSGGHLGSKMAHNNEAPFPEKLAEFFIKTLCPPEGLVLDPFCGSGTTAKVAIVNGRKAIASDIRTSQVELTKKRIAKET